MPCFHIYRYNLWSPLQPIFEMSQYQSQKETFWLVNVTHVFVTDEFFPLFRRKPVFSRKQKLTWLHEKSFVDYAPQWGKSQTVLCNRLLVLLRHNSKTFLIVWLSYLFRLCHWFRDKFVTELAVLCSPMKVDINTISLAWATLLLVNNKFVDSFTIPANYLSYG